MSRKILAVVVALSAACAVQKPQQKQAKNDVPYSSEGQAKPKGTMHCHMEQDTGSNRMERVCVYGNEPAESGDTTIDDAMLDAQRRAAQHVGPGMSGN